MRQDPFSRRIPLLFWQCLAFSFAAHLLIIFIVYRQPLWIAKWFSPFAHLIPQKNILYEPKEELFEGVFDQLIIVHSSQKQGFDAPSPETSDRPLPILENTVQIKEHFNLPFSPSFAFADEQTEGLILREPGTAMPIAFSTPNVEPPTLLVQLVASEIELPALALRLPKMDAETTEKRTVVCEINDQHFSPSSQPTSIIKAGELISLEPPRSMSEIPTPMETQWQNKQELAMSSPGAATSKDLPRFVQTYGIPHWDQRENWSDLFLVDVSVMNRKEQEGIYFAITLTPKPEALEKKMAQCFHFIVDTSKYTEKHRIPIYKNAIERALTYLHEGQSFNIYFVNNETSALSSFPMGVSKKSLAQARHFLEDPSETDYAKKGTLFSLLKEINEKSSDPDCVGIVDTVFLITDGAFLKHKTTGVSSCKNWLKSGTPSFLFYIATVGSDPHQPLLDALTFSSGGKVLHSMTHSAFPRKFAKLLIDLNAPLITNILPQLSFEDKDLSIGLMGTCCKTPPLFANQPTTFFGVASKTSSFSLNLDGWNHDNPIEVTFNIDLRKGKQGTVFMKQLALQDQAEHELSLYLANGEEAHFEQALTWMEEAAQPLRR
jgi:hypothetical protein